MGQSNYNKTRYFYSDGVVYKQKGDQAPVSIGTKWMKVYKVLLCIGTILGLFSLLPILANLVSLFYGFPVVYGLTCLLVNVADVAFTFAAYTALCSLSKKRYIYIIIQIIVKLVSIGVITYGQYYTASLLFRMLMVGLIIAFFSVAWSLPNIIYFKHRECMFTGDDPEEDVKIGRVASEENAIPNAGEIDKAETNIDPAPQAKAKVKVVPHRIAGRKADAGKPTDAVNVSGQSKDKRFDWKWVVIIALAVLLIAAVVYILFDNDVLGENGIEKAKSQYVYVSYFDYDDYYHKNNCYYGKQYIMKKITKYDAVQQGYTPCPTCMG